MRILVVEDEPSLRDALVDLLGAAGHEVDAVEDGTKAVESGSAPEVDLALLDLMLPGLDGIEVCRRLRLARPDMGILILTARDGEEDKVAGLAAGADDYVTKPFGSRELLARVEVFARRMQLPLAPTPSLIEVDGSSIDLGRCEFDRLGTTMRLTAREAGILRWLFHNRARAVGRAELLEQVWGCSGELRTRTVDMTIANLRQKIERDPADPRIVVTIRGIGYAWGGA